jgi:hypothetical protein
MAPLMNAYGNSCPSPYRLHIGVFFGSLHGTLNHLLLTDRLWLQRLTGEGDHPNRLDAILYEGRTELTRARIAEDNRLIAVIDKYDGTTLANLHSYKTTSGMPQSQVLAEVLRVHAQHSEPYPPFRKGRSCHRGGTYASSFRSRLQPPLRAGDAFRCETDLAEFCGALRCGHRWRLRRGLI